MNSLADIVRGGFGRFLVEGPNAIAPLFAEDADWLAAEEGEWDCHGRDAILDQLGQAFEGHVPITLVDCTQVGDRVLAQLDNATRDPGERAVFSVVTFRDRKVVRMKNHRTEAEARRSLA